MPPLLLDTHAVIWLFEDISLAPKAMSAIEAAYRDDTPLLVSPITACGNWPTRLAQSY
jgi:PIN domain nuclease of toxin-antitoxin system